MDRELVLLRSARIRLASHGCSREQIRRLARRPTKGSPEAVRTGKITTHGKITTRKLTSRRIWPSTSSSPFFRGALVLASELVIWWLAICPPKTSPLPIVLSFSGFPKFIDKGRSSPGRKKAVSAGSCFWGPSGSADRTSPARTCRTPGCAGFSSGSSSRASSPWRCPTWTRWSSGSETPVSGSPWWRTSWGSRCRCCCARPTGWSNKTRVRRRPGVDSSRLPDSRRAERFRRGPATASTVRSPAPGSSDSSTTWRIYRATRRCPDETGVPRCRYFRRCCSHCRCCTRRRLARPRMYCHCDGGYDDDNDDNYVGDDVGGGRSARTAAWSSPYPWPKSSRAPSKEEDQQEDRTLCDGEHSPRATGRSSCLVFGCTPYVSRLCRVSTSTTSNLWWSAMIYITTCIRLLQSQCPRGSCVLLVYPWREWIQIALVMRRQH